MKKCPGIVGITFDEKSQKGIDRIRELHDLTKVGRFALMIGHLFSIFGGSAVRTTTSSGFSSVFKLSNPTTEVVVKSTAKAVSSDSGQISYSISQANWEYFFESFGALDKIKMRELEKLATMQAMSHTGSPKEYVFWRAISEGCKL